MKLLEDRIRRDGIVRDGDVLKVDSFLNHQMDVAFCGEIGKGFERLYHGCGVNKILTIEASGIGIACVAAQNFGCPVVFDATHSVQQPSSQAGITGGNREMVPYLMRAALAVGVDGLFIETHPEPEKAISDAANQVRLADMKQLLEEALKIDQCLKNR